MSKSKSVILIGFMPNPRMKKRIELEKDTFSLYLICWDKGKNMLAYPMIDGIHVHKIEIEAVNDPLKRLIPYFKFSKKAYDLLVDIKPSLIHVQGLDMLKIAVSYKLKVNKNVKIIYEVADVHRLIAGKQKNIIKKLVQKYLISEDRRCSKYIDLLIVTSPKHIESYFGKFINCDKILCIPNIPDLSMFTGYKKKVHESPLVVGYIGSIRYKDQIRNLIEAVDKCSMKIMFAGYEEEPRIIEPMCLGRENIEWNGRFDFNTQIAELYSKCDLMYSVYNADIENVRLAIPNKLYESVYCRIPIIVAKNTYLAEKVNEWGVGVAVNHKDIQELIDVLDSFKDNSLFEEYEANCEKHMDEIDLEKYNLLLSTKIMSMIGNNRN